MVVVMEDRRSRRVRKLGHRHGNIIEWWLCGVEVYVWSVCLCVCMCVGCGEGFCGTLCGVCVCVCVWYFRGMCVVWSGLVCDVCVECEVEETVCCLWKVCVCSGGVWRV